MKKPGPRVLMRIMPLLTFAAIGCASLEEEPPTTTAETDSGHSNGWRGEVYPYIWYPTLQVDSEVDGNPSSGTTSESDIQLAAFGTLEAGLDRLSLLLDFVYADVETRFTRPIVRSQLDVEGFITEAKAGYRIVQLDDFLVDEGPVNFWIEGLAGLRYYVVNVDLETPPLISAAESEDWLDPVVGARAKVSFFDKVSIVGSGDFGGFNVGSESTWSALGGLEWAPTDWVALVLGYRVLDVCYGRGSSGGRFRLDLQLRGPVFGVAFRL